MALYKQNEAICLELGYKEGLARGYRDEAEILFKWERLEEAMALSKQNEAIWVELGNRQELIASYRMQAAILQLWGKSEEALALLKKQAAICLELGEMELLGVCYGMQALALEALNNRKEALKLADEVYKIAIETGHAPLEQVSKRIRARIKEAGTDAPLSRNSPDSFKYQQVDVEIPVPNASLVAESERLMQANLEFQGGRAEYERRLTEWKKLKLWKRLRTPRPTPPN